MKKQRIQTADGSHSFYLPEMDEQYHSKHGSIAESQHIFIEAGLKEVAKQKSDIQIFEVGMGTGLNVFLTALAARDQNLAVYLESIEAFPIDYPEAASLNYAELLEEDGSLFNTIHEVDWNKSIQLQPNFTLKKVEAKLEEYDFDQKFDLVYFDAFAPEKQAKMWQEAIFKKLFKAMNEEAVLVTYCVKGIIRRRLQALCFEVEKLPGPPGGKREMLRARKVKSSK
ncbi:MAG: tRNA (5-methylaminomethyl-2-thiouridine)(34)-methyltransferase MnmD [Vicingaceae bacterium]